MWNDQHMINKWRFGKSFQLIEECVDLVHSWSALLEGLHEEWEFDELLPQHLYHYVGSQWKGGCGCGRNFMLKPWNFKEKSYWVWAGNSPYCIIRIMQQWLELGCGRLPSHARNRYMCILDNIKDKGLVVFVDSLLVFLIKYCFMDL